jgi:hypothetical protein
MSFIYNFDTYKKDITLFQNSSSKLKTKVGVFFPLLTYFLFGPTFYLELIGIIHKNNPNTEENLMDNVFIKSNLYIPTYSARYLTLNFKECGDDDDKNHFSSFIDNFTFPTGC